MTDKNVRSWGVAIFRCAEGAKSHSPGQRPANGLGYDPKSSAACKAAIQECAFMPQSLSSLLTHLVFSTKNREHWLKGDVSTEIYPYLAGVLNNIGCPSIQVGGVSDHVHLFFRLSRTKSIADLVETVKTRSSKWIKTKSPQFAGFHWQSGYGAFSVSQSDSDAVIAYIRNQPEHHKRVSFQEEYRRFLERYNVAYDERYVWD